MPNLALCAFRNPKMRDRSLWQRACSTGGRFLRKLHIPESAIQRIKGAVVTPPPPLYPLDIPTIAIEPSLDFLLLELPPRYQPMMPNGIGYVHNVLLKTGVRFQTVNVNVLMYHRYHQARILGGRPLVAAGGYVMKDDPWENIHTAEWERETSWTSSGRRSRTSCSRSSRAASKPWASRSTPATACWPSASCGSFAPDPRGCRRGGRL